MVYTYTPTYYSSVQESITSICKNILPFSLKKRRLPAIAEAEQRLSKQQSDNLKWQQDSFHQILNLMGLCKEGIGPENEVSAFRTHLLETLIASSLDHEPTLILRDKLIFLQELLYAKCISEEEYHASKRPLLQRLAVQGAEIDARDVIVGANKEISNDEWSVIDLKDDQQILSSKNHRKESSRLKKIKGAASVFGFVSSHKDGKLKETCIKDRQVSTATFERNELRCSTFWNDHLQEKESDSKSILMVESLPSAEKQCLSNDKGKRKPFRTIFQRESEKHGTGNDNGPDREENEKAKPGKRAWVFDGFKKWKKNDPQDETAPLSFDGESYTSKLVCNPVGEGPDTKQIKRKLHPNGAPTDFFVDKVLGQKIKKKLSEIQTDLSTKDPNAHLTDDQIEAISTRLPVDKADLKKHFPKSWCDQYGDIVLDVVRKEFKDHLREMGNSRSKAGEKQNRFVDENSDPNTFTPQQENFSFKNAHVPVNHHSIDKGFKYNPFFDM